MSLKEMFVNIRDSYVINQANKAKFPEFPDDEKVRYRITFSGRVQHVGFRLEVCKLAKRLALTGFCQNLENGDVLTEIQGPDNKIEALITFMSSLKIIKISDMKKERMELNIEEKEFVKIKN